MRQLLFLSSKTNIGFAHLLLEKVKTRYIYG